MGLEREENKAVIDRDTVWFYQNENHVLYLFVVFLLFKIKGRLRLLFVEIVLELKDILNFIVRRNDYVGLM